MSRAARPPELSAVLGGLKDFQRDTVEHVFRRMYLDHDAADRFLVADEVGLGKTLVARGVIARAVNHLWDRVDRIDVLYICSNADIARQNVNRLNVTGQRDFALASRITLLPVRLHDLKANRLNFVSFTPGTSFELGNSLGTVEERVLLYWLLREHWNLGGRKAPLNVLQGNAYKENFRRAVQDFDHSALDPSLAAEFAQTVQRRVQSEADHGQQDIRARFDELCERFYRFREHLPQRDRENRARVVGELRGLLATSCLNALEPDLIVLDEFQRFKHLLDGTDQASSLARGLFEYPASKTLMLSATPYKMYTVSEESAEDDHYRDFLRTVDFLESGLPDSGRVRGLLKGYREGLFRLGDGGDLPDLAAHKVELEGQLRRVMVRTERLAVSGDRNGMLTEVPSRAARLEARDLSAYVALQRVARNLHHPDVLEYWKSAPYLLNFMDSYKLKQDFRDAASSGAVSGLEASLPPNSGALLSWKEIARYSEIDPGNARMRQLMADTVGAGAWRLLWVPPSMPYYSPEGAFADPGLQSFTKRLVFSSWAVVPKAITAVVSYEAERQMIRSSESDPENSREARERRRPLLRFPPPQEGRRHPPGMPVLGLLYPSTTLAGKCDPLHATEGDVGELPSLEAILERIRLRVTRLLDGLAADGDPGAPEDEAWYWAASILLDLTHDGEAARQWLHDPRLAAEWSGLERESHGEESTHWTDHVEEVRRLAKGEITLGRPPEDLSRVLALKGVAGPGVAALRALWRVSDRPEAGEDRSAAGRVAWALRSLFNTPEATALVRGRGDRTPYWRSVLGYCTQGNLQAALDEYAHVLRESEGLLNEPPEEIARQVSRAMREALGVRTSRVAVDEITADPDEGISIERRGMRGHFALRFGEETSDDGAEVTRAGQVRRAFNSPFRPFVLATTSVGQEGLDFHTYCHAVVHWNLPYNPVDMEQREGRVHRYKGHAVRKNLARRYGLPGAEIGDPWMQLFEFGRRDRAADESDIVPYWMYPLEGGARIERHAPHLPWSRDRARLDDLRRSLVAYRMVFGQARQEDLIAYLLSRLTEEEAARVGERLRIDLEPTPRRAGCGPKYDYREDVRAPEPV